MLKIENAEVVGFNPAIRGMRNPKNSHDRMDSKECIDNCDDCDNFSICNTNYAPYFRNFWVGGPIDNNYAIGPNDHRLMTSLAKGGPVHAKYRRMIVVYLDITAPLYWWKEFDTYKLGTVANSCSTMHKIHAKEFELSDFSIDRMTSARATQLMLDTVDELNEQRKLHNNTSDSRIKKVHFNNMIQLLPSSYNQKRTVMLNYEVLHNIYFSRKDHKLTEWHTLCDWIETLPYSELITTPMKNSNIEIEDAIKVLQDAGFIVVKEDKAEDVFDDDEVININVVFDPACEGCKYTSGATLKEHISICGKCYRVMTEKYKHLGTDNYTPQEDTK